MINAAVTSVVVLNLPPPPPPSSNPIKWKIVMVFILQYSNCITYVLFQVIDWLVTEGEELLSHHQDVCDNLKGIKAQQKDFDKLYFSAMVSQTNIFLGY